MKSDNNDNNAKAPPAKPDTEGQACVFAYGTLRDPEKDVWTLEGYRLETVARACHLYPVIVEDPGKKVLGNLMFYPAFRMQVIDTYEGVPYLYARRRVRVSKDGETREAWVYVPNSECLLSEYNRPIDSGDWLAAKGLTVAL